MAIGTSLNLEDFPSMLYIRKYLLSKSLYDVDQCELNKNMIHVGFTLFSKTVKHNETSPIVKMKISNITGCV